DLLKDFVSDLHVDAHIYPLDVEEIKNIESVFNEILKDEMVIDELIYCAGINYLSDAISITEDIWDKVMAVNLKGCFFVMKEVAKNMILNDNKGCMVSIGSQHG